MDPAYLNKKIVDLSDAELIALGFLGENVAPGVKRIVDKVKADPDRLGTVTCFMVDCVRRKYPVQAPPQDATQPPASPTSPTSPALIEAETLYSELSNDLDARTVVAPDLISKYEMNFWYHGVSGNPPKLMWRSDLETNPFPVPPPGTNFFESARTWRVIFQESFQGNRAKTETVELRNWTGVGFNGLVTDGVVVQPPFEL